MNNLSDTQIMYNKKKKKFNYKNSNWRNNDIFIMWCHVIFLL